MSKTSITLENVWLDDDLIELQIIVNDGINTFSVNVYDTYKNITIVQEKLKHFSIQVYGGLCDIKFGGFGQETAYGGFKARFHYANNANGKILISVNMQSDYFDFGIKKVASEAKMYLITEPGLLENFIRHLSSLENKNEKIELECVEKLT